MLARSLAGAPPITRQCSPDHSPVVPPITRQCSSWPPARARDTARRCSRHCSPVLATGLARYALDHSPVFVQPPAGARPITHRCSSCDLAVRARSLTGARPDTRRCPSGLSPVLAPIRARALPGTGRCSRDHQPVPPRARRGAPPITTRWLTHHRPVLCRSRPGAMRITRVRAPERGRALASCILDRCRSVAVLDARCQRQGHTSRSGRTAQRRAQRYRRAAPGTPPRHRQNSARGTRPCSGPALLWPSSSGSHGREPAQTSVALAPAAISSQVLGHGASSGPSHLSGPAGTASRRAASRIGSKSPVHANTTPSSRQSSRQLASVGSRSVTRTATTSCTTSLSTCR